MAVAEHSVWLDLLSADERGLLEPGLPRNLERRPDVLVVGGGIVGLVTAATCHQAGLGSVVVLERQRLGAGSTGGSAGLLVPEAHVGVDPDWFAALMRRSLELWRELHAGWPGGVGLLDLDWLSVEPLPSGVSVRDLRGAEELDPATVQRLVPGLSQTSGVLVRKQGRVNPLRACARLAAGLPGVATGVSVHGVRLDPAGERIEAVLTSAGELNPARVVFATGVSPRLDGLDLDLPAGEIKGHLVATEPADVRLPGAVVPVATVIDDGRVLVGSSTDPGDASKSVRPEVVDQLWQAFLRMGLPGADRARISHRWCCFRPWHPDGLPVLDRVPGLGNAWLTSGHYKTGVLMAAVTGRLLVDWIVSDQPPAEVRPMTTERFSRATPTLR